MERRYTSFREFYPSYLAEHRDSACRCRISPSLGKVLLTLAAAVLTGRWPPLLLCRIWLRSPGLATSFEQPPRDVHPPLLQPYGRAGDVQGDDQGEDSVLTLLRGEGRRALPRVCLLQLQQVIAGGSETPSWIVHWGLSRFPVVRRDDRRQPALSMCISWSSACNVSAVCSSRSPVGSSARSSGMHHERARDRDALLSPPDNMPGR